MEESSSKKPPRKKELVELLGVKKFTSMDKYLEYTNRQMEKHHIRVLESEKTNKRRKR